MCKKIHIFGAVGFIGKRLFEKFSLEGYSVIGYSPPDYDLLVPESLNSVKVNPEDVIIMVSSITRLRENSFDSMMKNMKMANNLSAFIEKNLVSQIVCLSTIDVYGINPVMPINEKTSLNPADYYAISKLANEFLLRKTCSEKNIPLFILRMSGVYGKGDEGKSTISKLIESARNGKVTIMGDGEDKRDFIFVDDVYRIIKEGISKKIDTTLNIGAGKSYTINEIVGFIKKYLPEEFSIEHQPKEGAGRIKDLIYDISLLKQNFPKFESTGLEKGIAYYIENINSFKESSSDNKMQEIDLMRNYPRTKRDPAKRAEEKTPEDKAIARQYGREFFDGDRKQGYGGYNYHPRFWTEVVKDMIKHYGLTENSSVLDVGCAKGFMLYDFVRLCPGISVKGIDISSYAIEHGKEEMREFLNVGDAKNLSQFKDKEFDLVVSITTVHNLGLEECKQAVKEIERIGKNAFITVDAWRTEEEKERMFKWNLTAETLRSIDDWKKLFEEVGYTGDYYWFIP